MSYTLVLEWMPGDLYMSAVTARCTAPTSSYSVVWLPPNKVYQITLYCGSTSLVSFLVGAFRGKAWSYMTNLTKEEYARLHLKAKRGMLTAEERAALEAYEAAAQPLLRRPFRRTRKRFFAVRIAAMRLSQRRL